MEKRQGSKRKKYVLLLIIGVLAVIVIITMLGGYRFIKVKSYEGDVELERVTEEKKIFKGMMLKDNDKVTTGDDGLMELLVDKDKHILAQENTCFKIVSKGSKKKGKLQIKLRYGTALVEIENKLPEGLDVEVETSNAMLSVRGTIFEATYDEEQDMTIVRVTEGVVKVTSDTDSQKVEAGYMAIVKDDVITVTELDIENEEDNDFFDMFKPSGSGAIGGGNKDYPAEGTLVSEEELPQLLRGEVTASQLEYVLSLAYQCSRQNSVNHITIMLSNIWFGEECPGIETTVVEGMRTYDVNALNDVLSVMSENLIQPQAIPTNCCELVGDELRFYSCDVTKGDYYEAGIDSVMYGVDGKILVDYEFHYYTGDRLAGCDGTARAHLVQDEKGKYYLHNIDIITEVPYSY